MGKAYQDILKVRPQDIERFYKAARSTANLCLYPGEGCANRSCKAHSLSKQRILAPMSDTENHIITVKAELKFTDGSMERPNLFKRVGINQATTFTGLCSQHDQELFSMLDNRPLDIYDKEYLFRLAYRAVLKEVHAKVASLKAFEKLHPDPDITDPIVNKMKEDYESTFRFKAYFDKLYLSQMWDKLKHNHYKMTNQRPTVAVSQLASFEGINPSIIPSAILHILPEERNLVVIFSTTSNYYFLISKFLSNNLCYFPNTRQFKLALSGMILKYCSNLVIAPDYYNRLTSETQEEMEEYLWKTSFITMGFTNKLASPYFYLREDSISDEEREKIYLF